MLNGDDVLLIEVGVEGRLYQSLTGEAVTRTDIAAMIISGRKYKVVHPQTGEDVTYNLGRYFSCYHPDLP
jgi:polyhydroxyalkanoate synthesis regulator protein